MSSRPNRRGVIGSDFETGYDPYYSGIVVGKPELLLMSGQLRRSVLPTPSARIRAGGRGGRAEFARTPSNYIEYNLDWNIDFMNSANKR